MPELNVRLLGRFRLLYDGQPVVSLDRPRLQALLAYLLLHCQTPQLRQQVSFALWPDATESQAHTNLRDLLSLLRRDLPDADLFLQVTHETLQWRPDAPFTLDVAEFERHLAEAEQAQDAASTRESLQGALALYQGALLPGCYDEWILPTRTRLDQAFTEALDKLVPILEEARDIVAAVRYAQQRLQRDTLNESAYRQLMRLHALDGNRAAALRVYHTCVDVLHSELGVEPAAETQADYQRVRDQGAAAPAGAAAPPRRAIAAPFVGRQAELERLQTIWRQTDPGAHPFVLLSGVAGIGKTRLAEEMLRWAREQGVLTAVARCHSHAGRRAYEPVMAWLRSNALRETLTALEDPWLVELARLAPDIRTQRPDLPAPEPIHEAWQRGRLYQALAQAFTRGDEALLLLLDDLQWCDQETLDWLAYLLRFASARQLLAIGTLRLGEGVRSEALLGLRRQLRRGGRLSELELQPLDAAGTATLARQLAGQPLEPTAAAQLFDETGGNPLFILERVRAGLGATREPGTRLTPKVQTVIETRLAGLSPLAGELVAIAATIGRAFTFELLAQASAEAREAVVAGLNELWQQRIVHTQGDDGYDFSHDKLRQVVYAGLSSARRRLLHRRVGEALERVHAADLAPDLAGVSSQVGISAQIATHYEKAHAWHQALRYYVQSAEHAAGLFAFHQAEGLYARAIDIAFKLNQPGELFLHLYVQRGRMLESAGRLPEAVALYQDLEQLARQRLDPRIACVALAQLGACLIKPSRVHDRHKADKLIARGLSLARENELYEQEAHLLWSQMRLATHYAGPAEVQEAGQACIRIARQHGLAHWLSLALHELSFNLHINGQLEEGDAYTQEARALFREHNNLPLLTDNLNQQALMSIQHLEFDSALACAREAGEISRQIENGQNLSYALWLRGWVAAERGAWGRAQTLWAESIPVGKEAGFLLAQTAVPAMWGGLQRDLGRYAEATATHTAARAASRRHAPFLARAIEAQLAQDAFAAGDVAQGQRWLQQMAARESLGEMGVVLALASPASASVEAARHSGDWPAALEAVDAALAEAQTRQLRLHHARLVYERGRCRVGLGQPDHALRQFHEALETAEERGLKTLRWRCHSALFPLCRSHGLTAEAASHRAAAEQLVTELSESLSDPEQRRSFRATPIVQALFADS